MFKSFPRFMLKNGFEIILQLDNADVAVRTTPAQGDGGASGANGRIKTSLQGIQALAGGYDRWRLSNGKCLVRHTVPDDKHLRIMQEMLIANGELTLPFYSTTLSKSQTCSKQMNLDCSYSGS